MSTKRQQTQLRREVESVLTRIVNQAQAYASLSQTFPQSINLVDITPDTHILLQRLGPKRDEAFYLNYIECATLEATGIKNVARAIAESGYVHPDNTHKLLQTIVRNFANGIAENEMNYREQTPLAKQQKDLVERLKMQVINS